MTYLQAVVIGALQGITELFPVSSLGHSVLIPALLGPRIGQAVCPVQMRVAIAVRPSVRSSVMVCRRATSDA